MPRPFCAYLRVYEPLSAFDGARADRIRRSLQAGPLPRARVPERERELWLRSQLAAPPRLLPGDGPDGSPAPNAPRDVLVLDPAEIPGTAETSAPDVATADPATETPPAPRTASDSDTLVCPLDLRPRSATALVGFLSTATGPLVDATLPVAPDAARSRASAVMAELASNVMHAISATWTVPLPWFALFDPEARQLVLAPRDDPERQVSWRARMSDARQRAVRSHTVVSKAIGEDGPARMLRDTGRWLEQFHPASIVELDYGGLVQLLDDNALLSDTSATDVHAIVDALENGDAERVSELYERLRDFWGELAAQERYA